MYAKIIQSGNYLEIYEFEYPPYNRISTQVRTNAKKAPIRPSQRRKDNLIRAKKSFIRLVKANLSTEEKPCFLTLTNVENIGITEAYKRFSEFNKRIGRIFGKSVRVIAVPEFHPGGHGIHFHALVWGIKEDILLSERVYRRIQNLWGWGYVDCILTDGHEKLSWYLAKYMYKSMSDDRLLSQKSYTTNRSVLRSVSVSSFALSSYLEDLVGDNLPLQIKTFDTKWLGRVILKEYLITSHGGNSN